MTLVKRTGLVLFLLVFTIPFLSLAENRLKEIDVKDVVKKIDELYRSKTSYAEMEMQVVTPHWERTLTLKGWTKGMDKTFILITSPKKEKGVATLRLGNKMWNYLPKTNKVMKIPPSMMMGSWMGSDFTNDDLVKESSMLNDYNYQLITPEDAQAGFLYIELTPKEDLPIVWGKLILAVKLPPSSPFGKGGKGGVLEPARIDYIPVWQKFYDEKGRLMRVLNFRKIKEFGSRKIPSIMEMTPQNKKGHKTIIRYLDAKFDVPIDDDIFTLRNLRKRR